LALVLVFGFGSSSCLYIRHPVTRGGQPVSPATPPILLSGTPDDLNSRVARIYDAIHSFQATMEMKASVGSVYRSAAITEITAGVEAYVLFRKPAAVQILGKYPVVGSTAFDMVSTGGDFKMYLAAKNLFVTGSDAAPTDSKNALENLRPGQFLAAILIRPADLSTGRIFIEDDTDVDHAWSILQFTRKGPGDTDLPDRSVWFDRSDLRIIRQRIFDDQGLIVSDTTYDKWLPYAGAMFPSHIDANFKKAGYGFSIDVTEMKMNVELTDDKFVLEQPAGSKLQVIGGTEQH
jgi:hypothetical protein